MNALTSRARSYWLAALLGLAISPALAAPQASPAETSKAPPAEAAAVEAALQQGVRNAPEEFAPLYALASFYARQGRLSDAIPLLEKASRLAPGHYGCGYDLALAYLNSGAAPKARQQIQLLLARQDKAELHNLLGSVEEASGDPTAAAKEMQRAAEMDPSEKNIFDFGNILLRYGAYDGSLQILRHGVEKYPRSAQLRVALGAALHALRRYDEAVEALCQAVDLDPSDSRALYFLGQMRDISPSMANEVSRRLENFVRLYPQNASANYYYAMSLWRGTGQEAEQNLKRVEELLTKAVTLDERLYEAQFQLGALYERLGRDAQAIRQYEKTVKIEPAYEAAYYKLGHAYQRTGHDDQAKQALAAYQRLHAKSLSNEGQHQKAPAPR
jgi:tetratricopeptide (TPR) repeat protein